jgi:hypothetical protein
VTFPGGKSVKAGLALGLLGFSLAAGAAPEPVQLVDRPGPMHLGRHLQLLYDDSGTLTIDHVRSPQVASDFVPNRAEIPSFGFLSAAVWYRTALRGLPHAPSDWVLQI